MSCIPTPEKYVIPQSLRNHVRAASDKVMERFLVDDTCDIVSVIACMESVMMLDSEPRAEGRTSSLNSPTSMHSIAGQKDDPVPVVTLNFPDPFVILRPPFTN